ncbi:hypothetical protein Y032_0020g153 [Ancylostoma ceylanicum]|uniref:Uncharacterized protein n=1 Tax=Ancylostoma ceylanicum TaxID=53326 RepID=A0A016V1R4_9BILA|nr:hypothetical protein Y032_0020g153 [Ancylostoma ceylanicum]
MFIRSKDVELLTRQLRLMRSEYGIPYYDNPASPIHSLTSLSGSNNERFLDEIALLKQGKITRDTPRHTYRRSSAESTGPSAGINGEEEGPITLAELNSRGLMLSKDRIIYNIPHGTLRLARAAVPPKTSSSNLSTITDSSTSARRKNTPPSSSLSPGKPSSISSFREEPATCSKEFYVGNPGENAKLKISTLKDGISYRLCIMDDICLLQKTAKNTMLLCWKSR